MSKFLKYNRKVNSSKELNGNLYSIKCPNLLLSECNIAVEGLKGEKVHKTKILAYYLLIRKVISSGHVHNYSKVPANFTQLKGLFSNNTFKKYNLLLVKYNFASLTDDLKGIKINSLSNVEKSMCKQENTPYFKIKFDISKYKFKEFHKSLFEQLFDDTLSKVFKADELNHVDEHIRGYRRKIAQEEHMKKYDDYFTTTIQMSNKQIGKMFNMSRNFAPKFKKYIMSKWKNENLEIKFCSYQVNAKQFADLINRHPYFKYYNPEPTYYLNRQTGIKNLGQRLVVIRK